MASLTVRASATQARPQASSDNFSDSPDRAATRCARHIVSWPIRTDIDTEL
jgi:hypothetical protein